MEIGNCDFKAKIREGLTEKVKYKEVRPKKKHVAFQIRKKKKKVAFSDTKIKGEPHATGPPEGRAFQSDGQAD